MELRTLTPDDALPYRQLMLQAYAQHPQAFTSSEAERAALPLSWWQTRLGAGTNAPTEQVLAACSDGQLAGVAGLEWAQREKVRHKATLFGMVVAPTFRRQGLGQTLVHGVLDLARQHPGLRLVQLTVSQDNPTAEALYQRCGFVRFGLEPLAVATDQGYVAKVHMWCDLGLPPRAAAR